MQNEVLPPSEQREKEFAALGYLWIFSIMILLAKRDSHFIQHHARRGFVLFLLSILLWVFPAFHYGEFAVVALGLYGFITAAMGNENHTPILSEIADGTLKRKHLNHYWHHAKHGALKMVNPDHIVPELRQEIKEEKKELSEQEKELQRERYMIEAEEKKLSSLYNRVHDDENRLDELADEVHQLEKTVDELKK